MCVTKLDVLDGLSELAICTGYRINGQVLDRPPSGATTLADCEPIYELVPGWTESTASIRVIDELPPLARAYLSRLEELLGVPCLFTTLTLPADTFV